MAPAQGFVEAHSEVLSVGAARDLLLEVVDVHKHFGGVVALDGASLECRAGEVHALLGANGSGKSTLAKVVTGVVVPDRGEVRIRGRAERITGPADMMRLGIGAVYQELSLIPQLSVSENIMLFHEPTRRGRIDSEQLWRRAMMVLDRLTADLGRRLPLHAPVQDLSPAEQQLVEIAKALSRDPYVLILDEATASLRKEEVEALFRVVRELKAEGRGIVFISHRMQEVYDLCDRATVLRNGSTVGTVDLASTPEDQVLRMMTGEELDYGGRYHGRGAVGPIRLRVEGLRVGHRVQGVSFSLHGGEVIGLGGLQGQGQSELLRALFGDLPVDAGTVTVDSREVRFRGPFDAVRNGVVLVPGNRTREGLFMIRSILENLTLPSVGRRSRLGFLSPRDEWVAASRPVDELQIKLSDLNQPVSSLSGGNQQKVVVGKWLLTDPRILLLDDPTKGVDVRARGELYGVIDQLRSRGMAVVLNSSDNSELLTLCDRVLVMYEGAIVDELAGPRLTEAELVAASLRMNVAASSSAAKGVV